MMDHQKIKEGVRLMLEGIGEDVSREGLRETPERIARMCEQIYGGLYEDAGVHLGKQFQATNNNIVIEKTLRFTLSANIISFLFTAKRMSLTFLTGRWQDSASWLVP